MSEHQSKSSHQNQQQQLQPKVTNDPRFRAGRKLIERGQVHLGAVKIFALLLSRTDEEFGETSLESVATGYEYGNALFLNVTRDGYDNNDNDKPGPGLVGGGGSSVARSTSSNTASKGTSTNDVAQSKSTTTSKSNEDELILNEKEIQIEQALEHMVKACTILYRYQLAASTSTSITPSTTITSTTSTPCHQYRVWAIEQLSRVLVGIGYVLSYQGKYADALNSYLNAIPYRVERLENIVSNQKEKQNTLSLEDIEKSSINQLKAHRLLVDVYILIVEAILKCPNGTDIIIAQTNNDILIKDGEKIQMAKTYYEKAREELQEVVILMSKLESKGNSGEKENVCHLATMVMEAGISLSTIAE